MNVLPVPDDSWMILRPMGLPSGCVGTLFLMGMPGYHRADGSPKEAYRCLQKHGVEFLVNLVGISEMEERGSAYAEDWKAGRVPVDEALHFPLNDYAAPADARSFARLAHRMAVRLKRGGSVAVHCANGMGRTGLLAVAVLMAMGVDRDEARASVRRAGSGAESQAQQEFLAEVEPMLRDGGCSGEVFA